MRRPHSGIGRIEEGPYRRDGIGKRGGTRVIYYFYNEDFPILLLALYAKNEKGNLTAGEKARICGLDEGDRETMKEK